MSDRQPDPPKGLSIWARGVWRELLGRHTFEAHELVVFRRALEWWDHSDAWLRQASRARGSERGRLTKQALDAAQAALRYWRTLRWPSPGAPPRLGRPPGPDWRGRRS